MPANFRLFVFFLLTQIILGNNAITGSSKILNMYETCFPYDVEAMRIRQHFNCLIAGNKVLVKQALGTLMQRFPVFLKALRYKLQSCLEVIMFACMCLHNFTIKTGGGNLEQTFPEDSDMNAGTE